MWDLGGDEAPQTRIMRRMRLSNAVQAHFAICCLLLVRRPRFVSSVMSQSNKSSSMEKDEPGTLKVHATVGSSRAPSSRKSSANSMWWWSRGDGTFGLSLCGVPANEL